MEYAHGFQMHEQNCVGCLACMRACPTEAIRVRHGKARVNSELCIDCGSCLKACTHEAITAMTQRMDDFERFAFKVAIPSPVLFGQFPAEVHPDTSSGAAGGGLRRRLGLRGRTCSSDAAIVDYVDRWTGARPSFDMTCLGGPPTRARSPTRRMTESVLVSCAPPRRVAGREIKRRYGADLGLAPEQVAAIYVTPCQARTVSVLPPAEGGRSGLDGAIGIPQVYNAVLSEAHRLAEAGERGGWSPVRSRAILRWATPRALPQAFAHRRYMSVTGLQNVIRVFDDVERGKLKDIDFLECYACWAGCSNGNLTVDNVYVSQAKVQTIMSALPYTDVETEAEVERRAATVDFSLRHPFVPRERAAVGDLRERVRRVKEAERVTAELPGVDCGLCGAPTCRALAHDVAAGAAARSDCVFFSDGRLKELRQLYLRRG